MTFGGSVDEHEGGWIISEFLTKPFYRPNTIDLFIFHDVGQHLQEVGLTRTIVAVDPDTRVTDLTCADSIQDMIETIEDLVREDILFNFNFDGRSAVIGDGDGGIQRTGNVVLV